VNLYVRVTKQEQVSCLARPADHYTILESFLCPLAKKHSPPHRSSYTFCPYGMAAGTSFEKALSLLLASTAVAT
jgi:hypothetical protein